MNNKQNRNLFLGLICVSLAALGWLMAREAIWNGMALPQAASWLWLVFCFSLFGALYHLSKKADEAATSTQTDGTPLSDAAIKDANKSVVVGLTEVKAEISSLSNVLAPVLQQLLSATKQVESQLKLMGNDSKSQSVESVNHQASLNKVAESQKSELNEVKNSLNSLIALQKELPNQLASNRQAEPESLGKILEQQKILSGHLNSILEVAKKSDHTQNDLIEATKQVNQNISGLVQEAVLSRSESEKITLALQKNPTVEKSQEINLQPLISKVEELCEVSRKANQGQIQLVDGNSKQIGQLEVLASQLENLPAALTEPLRQLEESQREQVRLLRNVFEQVGSQIRQESVAPVSISTDGIQELLSEQTLVLESLSKSQGEVSTQLSRKFEELIDVLATRQEETARQTNTALADLGRSLQNIHVSTESENISVSTDTSFANDIVRSIHELGQRLDSISITTDTSFAGDIIQSFQDVGSDLRNSLNEIKSEISSRSHESENLLSKALEQNILGTQEIVESYHKAQPKQVIGESGAVSANLISELKDSIAQLGDKIANQTQQKVEQPQNNEQLQTLLGDLKKSLENLVETQILSSSENSDTIKNALTEIKSVLEKSAESQAAVAQAQTGASQASSESLTSSDALLQLLSEIKDVVPSLGKSSALLEAASSLTQVNQSGLQASVNALRECLRDVTIQLTHLAEKPKQEDAFLKQMHQSLDAFAQKSNTILLENAAKTRELLTDWTMKSAAKPKV